MEGKKEYPNLKNRFGLKGTGGHWRKYSYTLKDIAKRKGVSIHAVRMAIARGLLRPEDIISVARYVGLPKWGRGTGGLKIHVEEPEGYEIKMPTLED